MTKTTISGTLTINFKIGFEMKKNILLLITAALFLCPAANAGKWYRFNENKALEIIRSRDGSAAQKGKLVNDSPDCIKIDFMGYDKMDKLPFHITEEDEFSFSGSWVEKQSVTIKSSIRELGKNKIRWTWEIHSSQELKFGKKLHFAICMNPSLFGRKIEFRTRKKQIFLVIPADTSVKNCGVGTSPGGEPLTEIRIPVHGGMLKISGIPYPDKDIPYYHAGLEKWGNGLGYLRINLTDGNPKSFRGSLDIEFLPPESVPLDLKQAANMGFADDVEGDRKGGWTDQGENNDLRNYSPGRKCYLNIPFDIIDPKTNRGKSAIVFANPERPYFLKKAEIPCGGKKFDWLYLLHSTAWSRENVPAGKIAIHYADGSTEQISVTDGKDTANWFEPSSRENAIVIWRGKNATNEIGLYLSRFPVKSEPVEKIVFSCGQSVWCIVAATAVSGKDLYFPAGMQVDPEVPIRDIAAGKNWMRFSVPDEILPGSILDFSFLSEPGEAGKHGKLLVRGDRFVFEKAPDHPVRFFGGNLCFDANFMTDRELEFFPKLLKSLGLNAVRLHHFDERIVKKGDKLEFDPILFDRFLKTFAAFKKAGFYITLDLFTNRVSGFEDGKKYGLFIRKRLIAYDPKVRASMEKFAETLLTTRNPYTGLKLAEDPALICVGLINENPLIFPSYHESNYPNSNPDLNRRYRNAYELWCQRTGRRPSEKPELSEWTKFNIDTHIEQYRHWKNFLKKLGVTVPVSDISTGSQLALALARNTFDYTDNHWYHDHPNLGKPPYRYSDDSTLLNYQDLPLRAIAQRIFGKPMMLTEWHYCAPNSYRAEGGIASGAYCALQGINGIFDFCTLDYSRELGSQMNPKRRRLTGPFTVLDDPINRLNNYVVALLYGRGDVQEASQCFSLNISSTIWNNTNLLQYISWGADGKKALPQPEFIALGLIGKIGCTITTRKGDDRTNFTNDELLKQKNSRKNIASGVARVLNQLGLMQNGTAVSSTKEIRLTPADKQLTVITSRSEGLVQAKASNSGKVLSVRNNSVFSAIFAGSIDNRPLQESRRILLLHLTDVKGEYAKITTKNGKTLIYKWGNHPYLLRRGTADVSLVNTASGKAVLYAVGLSGKRLEKVPFTEKNGILSFRMDNTRNQNAVFAYEFLRE